MEVIKIITLYKRNETNFEHNGIGILSDCIRADVYREINGVYYLELDYPLFDKKNLSNEIQEHRIIKAPTPKGEQLFRVKKTEKGLSTKFVYATHILYDLADNFIIDTNIVNKTRLEAIQQLLSNTMTPHNFTAIGNVTTFKTNSRIVRKNPVNAIFGDDDNSILNRFGGEIDIDNFTLNVLDEIGSESGEVISYGKNLTGIKETLDMSEIATRIIPQGKDELLLPEYYVDSPKIANYYQPITKHMKFDDISTEAMLREVVNKLYSEKHIDQPLFNYEIEFIYLGYTEEYKQYKDLVKLNLGDKITIRHTKLGIDLNSRIISYEYNSLLKKYNKIQLGTIKRDITTVIKEVVAEVEVTKEKIDFEVGNLDEKLTSKIEVTEQSILLQVSDVEENLQSQINVAAGEIELRVSKDEIISAINLSPEEIKINANKVAITGYVTFSDLSTSGKTTINGSNITTGTINASYLRGNLSNIDSISSLYMGTDRLGFITCISTPDFDYGWNAYDNCQVNGAFHANYHL